MNNQPPAQHESLSPEERDFARVVRALPGGGPPAALDALILKAATDAVASSSHSPRNPRWAKTWLGSSALWLGTAAASILTVGIGWQVFQSMSAPIYQLPDDQNVMSRREVDSSHKDEALTVDMIPAREPEPTSPPPMELAEADSAADAAASPAQKPQTMKPATRAQEKAVRQEMADAMTERKTTSDKQKTNSAQAAESDWVPQTAGMVAAAPIAAAAPPPPAASISGYSDNKEMEAVVVTGSRIKRVDAETSQPVQVLSRAKPIEAEATEDSTLAPAQWLDAIKHRVERNDIEGAKASLRLYKQTHPKLRIPEELKPLLK